MPGLKPQRHRGHRENNRNTLFDLWLSDFYHERSSYKLVPTRRVGIPLRRAAPPTEVIEFAIFHPKFGFLTADYTD
jgi:hypothetical protein